MKNFLIDILAFAALFSSVLVITSKNPVIAVIFLISVFVNAAGYLILLGIGFIGISYIIVYVGAIAVLFLFVIMMINIKLTDILEICSQYTKNIPLALAISGLFLYEIFKLLPYYLNNPYLPLDTTPIFHIIFKYIQDIVLTINNLTIINIPLGGSIDEINNQVYNITTNINDSIFPILTSNN